MSKTKIFTWSALVLLLALAPFAIYAKGIPVGATVELKALKKAGVPLHKEAKPSMMGRAAHGSKAKVLKVQKNWYQIKTQDGKTAWIVSKYIAKKAGKKSAAKPVKKVVTKKVETKK